MNEKLKIELTIENGKALEFYTKNIEEIEHKLRYGNLLTLCSIAVSITKEKKLGETPQEVWDRGSDSPITSIKIGEEVIDVSKTKPIPESENRLIAKDEVLSERRLKELLLSMAMAPNDAELLVNKLRNAM